LKDKVFAIAGPGGSASVATRIMLNQHGLKGGQNVTLVNYGSPPSRINSVKVGQAAATLITGATLSFIGDLKLFADLRDQNIPFQGSCLTMSTKFVKAKPQVAEAIIKGMWDGTRVLLDPARKAIVLESLKKNLHLEEAAAQEAYTEALKDFKSALPPRVSVEGVAGMIEAMAIDDPRMVNIKAEELIDNSIMDKLQKEGF
jgi:ABC-type nitrate/sulfonate/bicarbonate transport system substrate-binding protein